MDSIRPYRAGSFLKTRSQGFTLGYSHRLPTGGAAVFERFKQRIELRMHNPAHPGKILAYYLQDRTVTEVARHLGVTRPALSRVLNGKAGISADMALRISDAFGTEPELWLRLQAQRDLWIASRKKRAKVKPLAVSAAA